MSLRRLRHQAWGVAGGSLWIISFDIAVCVVALCLHIFSASMGVKICALGGTALCLAVLLVDFIYEANLVLLYRQFLLGTFAIFAVPEVVLLPGDALSPIMVQFQTVENAAGLAIISALALAGSSIVWHILRRQHVPIPVAGFCARPPMKAIFATLGTLFCLIHAYASPIIMLGALDYGSAAAGLSQGHFLEINTWGFAGLSCFLNLWIVEFRDRSRFTLNRGLILGYTFGVILYAFVLRGFRSEFVTFTITCIILYWQFRGRQKLSLKLVGVAILLAVGLGCFTLVMGAIRDAGSIRMAKAIALESIDLNAKTNEASTGVNVPTLNWLPNVGAAPLVMSVIGLHQQGAYSFMWGETLWQRLDNTLPRIINPLRTTDLAYIYVDRFNVVSTGGMPELAEDYLNFGIMGGLIVSGLISWLIFVVYRRAQRIDSMQSWALCGATIMSLIYSNIYGIGHVYKAALTGILLNVAIFYLYEVVIVGRNRLNRR